MEEKKFDKKIIVIIALLIALIVIIILYNNKNNSTIEEIVETTSESTSTTTSEATVEVKTIENTISTSGEITTSTDEKLALHATYYFSEIYYSEGDYVEEGANILQYTNGTYMTAPYNLVIATISVPSASMQCTNQHYIEVYSTDTLTMNLSIDEDQLSEVSIGLEVTITPTTNTEKTYTGFITKINNSGTYSSKGTTYTAVVTFENDGDLKVGMSGNANVILERAENAVVVPNEAITTEDSVKYVTKINSDGTTQQVEVETGISNDAYTEIKSGLSEGETVQITTTTNSSSFKGMFQGGMTNEGFTGGEMPSDMQMPSGMDSSMMQQKMDKMPQ